MPRFFVPSANFDGDTVRITGDDARHIARALRMAVGETVTVCDMHGTTHTCVLEKITDDGSTARIVESVPSDTEPPYPITLYQAFPKGDKMDVIVQKAVESGACAIVPFLSELCVSRPDEKSVDPGGGRSIARHRACKGARDDRLSRSRDEYRGAGDSRGDGACSISFENYLYGNYLILWL